MTQTDVDHPERSELPLPPVVRPAKAVRWSWIWLVPLLAVLMGASLLVTYWLRTGPTITVSFESAQDLVVGQTKLRYKDVVVGLVQDIKVAPDREHVLVQIKLDQSGAKFITQDSARFWVVRPRFSLNGVSGLGTLITGAYISVDTTASYQGDKAVYEFVGLEKPPEVGSDRAGTRYTLNTRDLGSLDVGSSVSYRRINVGQVIGYELSEDGRNVQVQVFIDAPYDQYVTVDTRFWNVSGVNVSLNSEGISMRTSSLSAILGGGVAFAQADEDNSFGIEEFPRAQPNTAYRLYDTRDQAMADPDGVPFPVEMHFDQSVRGLKLGASVDFRGMELGKIVDIDLEYNAQKKRFYARVRADLYALRFSEEYRKLTQGSQPDASDGRLLAPLIRHGLRAQMRASNLLTGQQYVALEFFPDAEPVSVDDPASLPVIIPTMVGNFDQLQQQISKIVSQVNEIPFGDIGKELQGSLKSMHKLINRVDQQLAPQANAALKSARQSLDQVGKALGPNAPLIGGVSESLGELARAARALRQLADYLQAHPESLVRGRSNDSLQ
ncbi:MCE family protein [Alcaligenaceae bacterium CGII-47]|nr:MCE family protein [Alcaligenaceae bacterium CGII-47]